jgi:hypothetical protein
MAVAVRIRVEEPVLVRVLEEAALTRVAEEIMAAPAVAEQALELELVAVPQVVEQPVVVPVRNNANKLQSR